MGIVHIRNTTVKGQITIFIIVGIVILFVLAFGMYIFSTLQKPAVNILAEEQDGSRACLEQVSEQAIEDVLLRGGAGSLSEFTAEQYRIAIRQGARVQMNDPVKNYGTYNLQMLCLSDGANRPNAAGDNTNSCLIGTYQIFEEDTEVLQHALQQMIYDGLGNAGCAQAPVTVIFGGDDVTIRTANTTARIDVRFKRIYNAAHTVIVKEIKDPLFDMRSVTSLGGCNEPQYGNECLLPGLSITADLTQPYTVVTVRDSAKLLRGGPAEMRFAIENRYPVLLGGALSAVADATTTEDLTVVDPDEDAIVVQCSGVDWASCAVSGRTLTVTLSPTCGDADSVLQIAVCDLHGAQQQSCNTQDVPVSVDTSSC